MNLGIASPRFMRLEADERTPALERGKPERDRWMRIDPVSDAICVINLDECIARRSFARRTYGRKIAFWSFWIF